MEFRRVDETRQIGPCYLPEGMDGARKYRVLSLGVAPMFGPEPTVVCYVVLHEGRLRRWWLR